MFPDATDTAAVAGFGLDLVGRLTRVFLTLPWPCTDTGGAGEGADGVTSPAGAPGGGGAAQTERPYGMPASVYSAVTRDNLQVLQEKHTLTKPYFTCAADDNYARRLCAVVCPLLCAPYRWLTSQYLTLHNVVT